MASDPVLRRCNECELRVIVMDGGVKLAYGQSNSEYKKVEKGGVGCGQGLKSRGQLQDPEKHRVKDSVFLFSAYDIMIPEVWLGP